MLHVAQKMLRYDRMRLPITLLGVVFAVGLTGHDQTIGTNQVELSASRCKVAWLSLD